MYAAFFRAAACLIAGLLSACDESQAFHRPEPGLERMLVQPRGERYGASSAFADGRTMREPVTDTVSREQPFIGQTQIETGRTDTDYVQSSPRCS